MLIPLICKQCGGKLEVEDTKISLLGESFIVLPNQNFECPHCGTKYISDDTSKHIHASGGGVAIGNLSFGGDVGNIVISSAVVENNSSTTPKKQTKKWWEFWK